MSSQVQIEVVRNPNETSGSLLRRFTRRVQSSTILKAARSRRYAERAPSKLAKKKMAIRRIEFRADRERKRKLGIELPNDRTKKGR